MSMPRAVASIDASTDILGDQSIGEAVLGPLTDGRVGDLRFQDILHDSPGLPTINQFDCADPPRDQSALRRNVWRQRVERFSIGRNYSV